MPSSCARIFSTPPGPPEMQAVVAEAAGAVGLVVINHEPGGVTFAMPGVSDLEEDSEGGGVNIPVAMVRETSEARLVTCFFRKGSWQRLVVICWLDAAACVVFFDPRSIDRTS